ncbi:MAG TPA: branched-chain amino acid transaminase [Vicinamibacteria bacterium]|jgi:branched-chain amino acid aminotransferase|nr:branched-chain amino acid transaminase [Vicinamibacteria bacterium]HYU41114.1 branched-chain amino acid transaminase [Vicinamibacteria bacterium]
MTFPKSDVIWMNGKLVPWDDARIHVGSHVIHYGSAVFEGVRCYNTPEGPAIFRLDAHTERLFNSAKIYRMDMPYTFEELSRAQLETVAANKKEACYIRPIVYRGYGQLGVNPFPCPVDVAIMVWDWGRYLGQEALETGVDVCVSSWARIAPNTLPAMAKTSANYMNSQLIKMEAIKAGYVEGIALDSDGYLSEGSGENLFLVKNGTLLTPPLVSSVLPGITRDTVVQLARRLRIPVEEARLPREMLYISDEVFMTGTAAEITPVRSVDKITIGKGARGPVTEALQKAFFDVIECRVPDEYGWLTPVRDVSAAGSVGTRRSTAG